MTETPAIPPGTVSGELFITGRNTSMRLPTGDLEHPGELWLAHYKLSQDRWDVHSISWEVALVICPLLVKQALKRTGERVEPEWRG